MNAPICVIGAGGSGLAALKTLLERRIPAVCFERGSNVGGNWRYENDSGLSPAYRSLRCNVSRRRMQYPSFKMPKSYGDYPGHQRMAEYFEAYADRFGLRPHIRFSTPVESVEPTTGGLWRVVSGGGKVETFRAVVVANGHHWARKWPRLRGMPTVPVVHSRDYRVPEPFAGRRVLVVGAGQSAVEIATELSRIAARTILSVRSGAHVLPRYVFGRPLDSFDGGPPNRLPWRFVNWTIDKLTRAARGGDPAVYGFRTPAHRILEQVPVVSSDLLPALRGGAITVRPDIDELEGASAKFADGAEEAIDCVICATGYRIELPFLSPALVEARKAEVPLYRRIASPEDAGLYFIGLVDAPSGLLPIVELQSAWLADVLEEKIVLPGEAEIWAAIDASERRTRERFPLETARSIRCDPHAYVRLLRRDRWRARLCPRWIRGRAAVRQASSCGYEAC
jgi:cation diffusion facilitator CzcD-associated flavoprotein CzcO